MCVYVCVCVQMYMHMHMYISRQFDLNSEFLVLLEMLESLAILGDIPTGQ